MTCKFYGRRGNSNHTPNRWKLVTLNIILKCIINCNKEISLHLFSLYKLQISWGCSSYGRALPSHARGMGIDTLYLHLITYKEIAT